MLAAAAETLLRSKPDLDAGELAERLKSWAAQNAIGYSDTPAGCDSPIQKAITIGELRAGDPHGRFRPFGRRRR